MSPEGPRGYVQHVYVEAAWNTRLEAQLSCDQLFVCTQCINYIVVLLAPYRPIEYDIHLCFNLTTL